MNSLPQWSNGLLDLEWLSPDGDGLNKCNSQLDRSNRLLHSNCISWAVFLIPIAY